MTTPHTAAETAVTLPPAHAATAGRRTPALLAGAVLVLAALALPWLLNSYQLFVAATVLTNAVALLGLNMLTGYNGQISLGHGAFFAVGAYAAAILMDRWDMPYWLVPLPAGGLCLLLGYLFGFPALRLGGFHLALATFALAVAFPQLLKAPFMEGLTGGVQGILLAKPGSPVGFLDDDQWLYYFVLGITAVLYTIGWNMLRGRVGRAIVAIRDQPTAAVAMGVNIAQFKSITFGVSAAYTGLGGALSAIIVQYVSPDSFGLYLSISLLTGIVVGGLASIPGSLFGAVFVVLVPNLVGNISKAAPWAIYGTVLIGAMYLMPEGIAGLAGRLVGQARRLAKRRSSPSA